MIGLVCQAVVELLQDAFDPAVNIRYPIDPASIRLMPDEKVPPYSGDYFLSVFGSQNGASVSDANTSLNASLGVSVCLTLRTTAFPVDDIGRVAYGEAYRSMSTIMWKVGLVIDKRPALFTKLKAMDEYVFLRTLGGQAYEYLRWSSTDPAPIPVYEDHFWARNEHLGDPYGLGIMGHRMTAVFTDAKAANLQYDENA